MRHLVKSRLPWQRRKRVDGQFLLVRNGIALSIAAHAAEVMLCDPQCIQGSRLVPLGGGDFMRIFRAIGLTQCEPVVFQDEDRSS